MRSVAAQLGVPWHETLLAPTQLGETHVPNSSFARTGSSIHAGAADDWVGRIAPSVCRSIEEALAGEMAALGEVPFALYYGSVDATPLFVLLAGLYAERAGDLETLEALWPAVEAGLAWIDHHGDIDRDGFDEMDKRILEALILKFNGGPVGINSLAVAIGDDAGTLEDVHEPYLIMQGYLKRTPQGRVALQPAYKKLGITAPRREGDFFGG